MRYPSRMGANTHMSWGPVDAADNWARQNMTRFLAEAIVSPARDHCDRVRRANRDGRFRELLTCFDELGAEVAGVLTRNYSFRRRFSDRAAAERGVLVYAERFLEKGLPVWLAVAADGTDGIHACYQRNARGIQGRFWPRAPLRQWQPPYWLRAGVASLPQQDAGPRGRLLQYERSILAFFTARFLAQLDERLKSAEAAALARASLLRLPPAAAGAGPTPRRPRKLGPIQAWEWEHGKALDAIRAAGDLSLEEFCRELDNAGIPLPAGWTPPPKGLHWIGLYQTKSERPKLSVLFSRLRNRPRPLLAG